MAANPGDLIDLAAAIGRIGATADPTITAAMISACSTQLQSVIGYQIASAAYTRTFNGEGGVRLMVPDVPITAVSAVTIDNVSIPPAADQTASGFVFDAKAVFLRGYRFARGFQNISVAYTAGFSAVPYDLQQACLDWVAMTYDRMDRPADATIIDAGDTRYDFNAISSKFTLIPPSILSAVQSYIRNYPV